MSDNNTPVDGLTASPVKNEYTDSTGLRVQELENGTRVEHDGEGNKTITETSGTKTLVASDGTVITDKPATGEQSAFCSTPATQSPLVQPLANSQTTYPSAQNATIVNNGVVLPENTSLIPANQTLDTAANLTVGTNRAQQSLGDTPIPQSVNAAFASVTSGSVVLDNREPSNTKISGSGVAAVVPQYGAVQPGLVSRVLNEMHQAYEHFRNKLTLAAQLSGNGEFNQKVGASLETISREHTALVEHFKSTQNVQD